MMSGQDGDRDALGGAARVGIALFFLVVLVLLLGAFRDYRFARWPLLLELLGASAVLVGILGILRKARGPRGGASAFAGDVAVVLAGGMVLGGGWAAALGLGAIAVAGLVSERRTKADERDGPA